MTGKFKPGHAPYNKGKKTEFLKMVRALSTMGGFATGLKELDIPAVIEGADDLKAWSKKAREISRALNQFATQLKKGMNDGAKRT
jgi:uncharacterized protein (DUF885 family)